MTRSQNHPHFMSHAFTSGNVISPPPAYRPVYRKSEQVVLANIMQRPRQVGNPAPSPLPSPAGIVQGSQTKNHPMGMPMPHPPVGVDPDDLVPIKKGEEDEKPAENLRRKYLKNGQYGWIHSDHDKYMYVAHLISKDFIPKLTGKLGLAKPDFDVTTVVLNAIHEGGLKYRTFQVIAVDLIVGLLHAKFGESAHIDISHPHIKKLVTNTSIAMWKHVNAKQGKQVGSGNKETTFRSIGRQINDVGFLKPSKHHNVSGFDLNYVTM